MHGVGEYNGLCLCISERRCVSESSSSPVFCGVGEECLMACCVGNVSGGTYLAVVGGCHFLKNMLLSFRGPPFPTWS